MAAQSGWGRCPNSLRPRRAQLLGTIGFAGNRAQMINISEGLYFAIRVLADSFSTLSPRAKAAIFGACGSALSPLLRQVEQASDGRWSFSELDPALSIVEDFAIGVSDQAEHRELRARLMASVPHGSDLDAPSSTYVQDVLICADGGLEAASIDGHPKPIWIQYAIEPMMTSLQMRDVDIIRLHGDDYWSKSIIHDSAMAGTLAFLQESISKISRSESVRITQYRSMVDEAAVLCPA